MTHPRFHNKIAVVTGGGSGIGAAITKQLAAEGATVHAIELETERADAVAHEIRESGGSITVHTCDVGDHTAMADAISTIHNQAGRIDILVNNAGIAHVGNLENTTEEDLDRLYRVNVKGVYNGMHAAVPHMAEHGGGAILNLASIASKLGIADRFAYSTTKGAVLTMTYSVARDYVDAGIRCNCVCPARVHTPFVDRFIRENYPGQEQQVFDKLAAYQPMGRMGQPDEIARLALFLCSDDAGFITGAAYDIDGGVTNLR